MEPVNLTQEEFEGWLAHPGTRAVKWLLQTWVREVEQKLGEGYFIEFPVHASRLVGSREICGRLLQLNYDDLMSEVTHATELERAEALGPGDLSEAVRAREEGKLN